MDVYVLIGEHSNGTEIMGIYKSEQEADEDAERYQEGADEEYEGMGVEFYVESYVLQ